MVIKNEEGWRGVNNKYHDSWQEAQESFAKKFGWDKPAKPEAARKLRAFLSHVHEDRPLVLDFYDKLAVNGVQPWIDKRSLVGGQIWKEEITKAIRETDAFIACLSTKAMTSRGYFRNEIKEALSVAKRQPKGSNFLIPVKLELPIRSINFHHAEFQAAGTETWPSLACAGLPAVTRIRASANAGCPPRQPS